MTTLTLVLSGDAAGAACERLKTVLGEFEPGLQVTASEPAALPAAARKAVDPVALASLVLAVPSFILAVLDIADRIEKRRRAQRLIDEARRLRAEQGVAVFIVDGAAPRPFDALTADTLLDVARNARPD